MDPGSICYSGYTYEYGEFKDSFPLEINNSGTIYKKESEVEVSELSKYPLIVN